MRERPTTLSTEAIRQRPRIPKRPSMAINHHIRRPHLLEVCFRVTDLVGAVSRHQGIVGPELNELHPCTKNINNIGLSPVFAPVTAGERWFMHRYHFNFVFGPVTSRAPPPPPPKPPPPGYKQRTRRQPNGRRVLAPYVEKRQLVFFGDAEVPEKKLLPGTYFPARSYIYLLSIISGLSLWHRTPFDMIFFNSDIMHFCCAGSYFTRNRLATCLLAAFRPEWHPFPNERTNERAIGAGFKMDAIRAKSAHRASGRVAAPSAGSQPRAVLCTWRERSSAEARRGGGGRW